MKQQFIIEEYSDNVKVMSEDEFQTLCKDAEEVDQTPEEYGDFIYIHDAKTLTGEKIVLGFVI